MRVCDYIAERLHRQGIRYIYGLMGGGAAGLNDGFIAHEGLTYVCFHNEQGAGHAAVGEAKLTGLPAVVNPTTGCGGTNCITSLLAAWQDSLPVIFISGNVRKDQCSRWINNNTGTRIRKYGIQEHDIISTVSSMTKQAVFVESPEEVPWLLEVALREATTGRPGPVWIDIPADVQVANIPTDMLFPRIEENMFANGKETPIDGIRQALDTLSNAKRPVVLAGQGIKQSRSLDLFSKFIEAWSLPFVSTYGARDLVPYSHPLNIGAIGIKGSRVGNFVMQASDALLVLGCSVNTSHIGYDPTTWAPLAQRILVDVDEREFDKGIVEWHQRIACDINDFLSVALEMKNV